DVAHFGMTENYIADFERLIEHTIRYRIVDSASKLADFERRHVHFPLSNSSIRIFISQKIARACCMSASCNWICASICLKFASSASPSSLVKVTPPSALSVAAKVGMDSASSAASRRD